VQDVVCYLWGRAGFDRAAQGILGVGRRLADSWGGKSLAVVLGPADDALTAGAQAIADTVMLIEDALLSEYHPENFLTALATVCKQLQPKAVLLGNDAYSQELAPRLAHRLGGSAAGDAVEVASDGGPLRVTRGVYGGKATAVIALARSPGVVWVRARAMEPAAPGGRPASEVQRLQLGLKADERVKVLSRHVEAKEGVRLEDARLIVSGGRGLGGPEPFKELQALAKVMGAQMAASRAACDAGWVPPSWQVGPARKSRRSCTWPSPFPAPANTSWASPTPR
jgi:electron transfer flavoprotein alpha subunit